MFRSRFLGPLLLAAVLLRPHAALAGESTAIAWQPWSDAVFDQARREQRLVILDLEAVWCHWCHVMDETTYADPAVARLIATHYVAVRVDQDARPDLSNRYEDYGWPATILFAADGRELARRRGYLEPGMMVSMLQAFVDDPTPGPSVEEEAPVSFTQTSSLSPGSRRDLEEAYVKSYDTRKGSWGSVHKFLDWDAVELSLVRAASGDSAAEGRARQTLEAEEALLDPVWGGVYQYSTGGDWKEPHFEKIASTEAGNLRVYALAYAQWRDPRHLRVAEPIRRYLETSLTSPEGAFYTSQDADLVPGEHAADYFALDDGARRARGIPRVDTNVYTRENGWIIEALAALYAANGEAPVLAEAGRAADWIIAHRALRGGGFAHGADSSAGPYLGDTLAMGRAFLALYGVTGDPRWLRHAEGAQAFVDARFRVTRRSAEAAGFATSAISGEGSGGTSSARAPGVLGPRPERDENAAVARFANLLYQYTGKPADREMAKEAMRYLAAPEIARSGPPAAVLLADDELGRDPLHVTIVGAKDDPAARALFAAAAGLPGAYRRIEWWDRREGPLRRDDVSYPELRSAAAFPCTAARCGTPIVKAEELRPRVEQLARQTAVK